MVNKRIALLCLRNMAVAVGVIIGLFLFGFAILFLNNYFGTTVVSIGIVTVLFLSSLTVMCYTAAVDQFNSEQRRHQNLMDRLRRD